jgi:hypothetical protein
MPKKSAESWKAETSRPPHDLVLTRYSPKGEPELELIFEWKRIGKRSEVVAVLIRTPDFARPLTVGDIRGIPFSLLESIERQAKADFTTGGHEIEVPSGPQSGRPLSEDDLQVVANLYRDARERGLATGRYLAQHLHISESTATKRIAAARRAGFLGPALGTKAGEVTLPNTRRAAK